MARIHDVHEEKKPKILKHKCEICPQAFETPGQLKLHIKEKHEGRNPPYPCKLCKSGFDRKFLLNKHLAKIHKGGRHFQCPICPEEKFGHRSNLEEHVGYVHQNVRKPYRCQICEKAFPSYESFNKHNRKVEHKF